MALTTSARRAIARIWTRGALIIVPLLIASVFFAGAARWYRLLALVVLAQLLWSSVRAILADRQRGK